MKRIGSVREVDDVKLELPAGAAPYEEFDFQPYVEEARSEEELRRTWRVFTKVKDVLDNGRRLENASWRLWFKERSKAGPPRPEPSLSNLEKYDLSLDANLRQAEEETDRIVGDMFAGVGERFQQERADVVARAKAQRTQALLELADKHSLPDAALDDLLSWVTGTLLNAEELRAPEDYMPQNVVAARDLLSQHSTFKPRPRVAAFCHSLERNAPNIFLLYLVRELRDILAFEVVAAKEGPMRADYDAIDVPVTVCATRLATYPRDVRTVLRSFSYVIANTIMTTEVINASHELGVPCLWVIHEAWPRDQLDFYARDVFRMTYLSGKAIVEALGHATRVVFPTEVQRRCYDELVESERSRVIYNGVPLASINAFRTTRNRNTVRQELGYSREDLVLVQVGTVCQRKAQLITCQAFAELHDEESSIKLLIVGARYSREHEMEYIEECKQTLEAVGADDSARIIEAKKNVLPYYLAADIILCPSLSEVLPLVICEAMAFERPVIASNVDGIPEAVQDGVEGLLVEAGNVAELFEAIEKLAGDSELRARMGTAGRKRVLEQFSFETMSKTYRETIEADLELDVSDSGDDVGVTGAQRTETDKTE